jgi:hypothetical protein
VITIAEMPWRPPNWRQEQLPLYHHFVTTTAISIFRVGHIDFWRDQVARISSGVDVVYESLLALGAAHRGTLLSYSTNNAQEVAKCKVLGYSAYGRAVSLLAKDMTQVSATDPCTILIVLLLCTYFEVFNCLSYHPRSTRWLTDVF